MLGCRLGPVDVYAVSSGKCPLECRCVSLSGSESQRCVCLRESGCGVLVVVADTAVGYALGKFLGAPVVVDSVHVSSFLAGLGLGALGPEAHCGNAQRTGVPNGFLTHQGHAPGVRHQVAYLAVNVCELGSQVLSLCSESAHV